MTLDHALKLRDESEAMLHQAKALGLWRWAESYQARLHALAGTIRRKEAEARTEAKMLEYGL
jgi:hypothetical protein